LIRDGAHPVLGVHDLIAELGLVLGAPLPPASTVIGLPITGIAIDLLPEFWGCTPAEAMTRITMMEIAGEVRRDGDSFRPVIGAVRDSD